MWGVNPTHFLQENIRSENSTEKSYENYSYRNLQRKIWYEQFYKKMVWRGKYWDFYGEFYLVGKTTRNLQKWRF